MWANVPRYVAGGRMRTMQRWIERLSPEEIGAYAPLALTAAHCQMTLGNADLAEHWTSAAAAAIERGDPAEGAASLEAGLAILRAELAADVGRMGEEAARAYELEGDDSPWRSLCCLLAGVARYLSGERAGARERLDEGVRRAAMAHLPEIQALCLAQLAMLASDADGSDDGAEAMRARSLVEHAGLAEYPTMALVFATSADALAGAGRVEDAASDRRRSLELLAMLSDNYVPWYQVEVRVVLAGVALRLSDVPGAKKLVSEAEGFLPHTPGAVMLHELLDEASARVEAFVESSVLTPSSLTTAELRVLHLLPTHLSFREIAERLYVSSNTVKTQAHAVYRKLDASSRSEAVENARARGLLDASDAV